MEKRYLTKQLPSKWPFSHGVAIKSPGTIIILAGQVAFDRHGPNRQLVGAGDLAAPTRQAIPDISTLLGPGGATLKDAGGPPPHTAPPPGPSARATWRPSPARPS